MVPVWEKAFTVVDENGKRVEDGRKYEILQAVASRMKEV